MGSLESVDKKLWEAICLEEKREIEKLELIASENFVSDAVREAAASVMTHKYAEGYPGRRYYGGCEFVDIAEELARERALKLFGADHANVQPHAGSQANMAAYFSVLEPGDTILGMNLSHGGHLTHGHPVNFSGMMYKVYSYTVERETEQLDYDHIEEVARESNPKMIICGASAYPRIIDFKRFRQIADAVGAYLLADIAHIAGLVVAGLHPDPVPYCDFITTTTHKTLRGPRGGLILCRKEFAKAVDKSVFPGIQGGPLMHIIASKAVAFQEALQPSFKEYQKQIVKNAEALSRSLQENGLRLVSGGTDNHLLLVDVSSLGLTGKKAENYLDRAGITTNKNTIPFDKEKPFVTSGIRIGTPAVTTRGMKEEDMKAIAGWIKRALEAGEDDAELKRIEQEVKDFNQRFPLYAW